MCEAVTLAGFGGVWGIAFFWRWWPFPPDCGGRARLGIAVRVYSLPPGLAMGLSSTLSTVCLQEGRVAPSPEMKMLGTGSSARLDKGKSRKSWSLLPHHSKTSASCSGVGMGAFGPSREWSWMRQKLRTRRKRE